MIIDPDVRHRLRDHEDRLRRLELFLVIVTLANVFVWIFRG